MGWYNHDSDVRSPLKKGDYKTPQEYHRTIKSIHFGAERTDYFPVAHYSISCPGHVMNSALNKAYDKGKSYTNFFEDLYEAKGTAHMLRAIGPQFLHRVKSRSIFIDRRDVPSAWLAFNFGIRPLLSSATKIITETQREIKPLKVEETRIFKGTYENVGAYATVKFKYEGNIKVGFMCIPKQVDKFKTRLGLDSIVYNAWQVAGWSWAVDYFVDVSSWLKNLEDMEAQYVIRRAFTVEAIEHNYDSYTINPYQPWMADMELTVREARLFSFVRGVHIPAFQLAIAPNPLNVYRTSLITSAIANSLKDYKDVRDHVPSGNRLHILGKKPRK